MSLALLLVPLFLLAEPVAAIDVRITPLQPSQGELVVIELLDLEAGTQVQGTFNGVALRFFSDTHGRMRALTAVALQQPQSKTIDNHLGWNLWHPENNS
jgi:hypothetical protein